MKEMENSHPAWVGNRVVGGGADWHAAAPTLVQTESIGELNPHRNKAASRYPPSPHHVNINIVVLFFCFLQKAGVTTSVPGKEAFTAMIKGSIKHEDRTILSTGQCLKTHEAKSDGL